MPRRRADVIHVPFQLRQLQLASAPPPPAPRLALPDASRPPRRREVEGHVLDSGSMRRPGRCRRGDGQGRVFERGNDQVSGEYYKQSKRCNKCLGTLHIAWRPLIGVVYPFTTPCCQANPSSTATPTSRRAATSLFLSPLFTRSFRHETFRSFCLPRHRHRRRRGFRFSCSGKRSLWPCPPCPHREGAPHCCRAQPEASR